MILAKPLRVTAVVGALLDQLGVPWLVGGSLASSIHGVPRATQDVDLVADLRLPHLAPFVAAMESDFYCAEVAVRDAIRRRASFNVIHYATAMKVDIFMLKGDALSRAEMDRRVFQVVGDADGARLPVASPEDIILQKLDCTERETVSRIASGATCWGCSRSAGRPSTPATSRSRPQRLSSPAC